MTEHALAQMQQAKMLLTAAKDSFALQHYDKGLSDRFTLQPWQIKADSPTFAESRIGHDFSRVPALTSMAWQNRPMFRTQPMVQRFPKDGTTGSSWCPTCPETEPGQISATAEPTTEAVTPAPEAAPTPVPSEPTQEISEERVTPEEVVSPELIVEDSAIELSPGQMTKSEFLSQLRAEVCRSVEAALEGTGRTTADCPYVNHWFDFYSRKDSAHIERAIRRYAPETSSANTANGYISVIAQRAQQAADTWVRTGEITGVPQGVPTTLPGEAPSENGEGATGATSLVMFKAREGGVRAADDPRAIQAEMGDGLPLDSHVRSRMELAFGMDFSHVRTHTDTTATGLSNRFNARAFTVGKHVAFGSGEYQPGTIIGDALIAHELAHVVQQGAARTFVAPKEARSTLPCALEEDADKSAVGAVASLWRDARGALAGVTQGAMPRLRSGLTLQRCATTRAAGPSPETAAGAALGESACPEFISMPARASEPTVSVRRGRCRMGLGYCSTIRGTCGSSDTSGATITATVETAEGCTGELSFLQNLLNSDRRRTLSDGTHECMTFTTPHRDGIIPWKGCTLSVATAGRHTITTDDCPNIKLRETFRDRPGVHMTAASANDSFKMFLMWRSTGESARGPIANVTWGWSGSTTRHEGTDCVSRWTELRGSGTDGDGTASTDRPVTSPTVREDYRWEECEE